jgi:hypothetical protein
MHGLHGEMKFKLLHLKAAVLGLRGRGVDHRHDFKAFNLVSK